MDKIWDIVCDNCGTTLEIEAETLKEAEVKSESIDCCPSKEEIKQEMELHNADEVGQLYGKWTLEDAEYHLLLSDKYHKPEKYVERTK